MPGWTEQIEKPGTQAWNLTYSEKEFEYKASGTYGSFSDEEGESEDDEEEVKNVEPDEEDSSMDSK